MAKELITTEHLYVEFTVPQGRVCAVSDLNITVYEQEILCLLGESGCGKSVLGNTILRLLPDNAVARGKVEYAGNDILTMSEKSFHSLRGREIAMDTSKCCN